MSADPPPPSLAGHVRAADPDRFLCALFAPAAVREEVFLLVALNDELARAREVASNPMIALIRLQWWRDAIAEAADGRPPRRHEVAGPLHAAIRAGRLDPAELEAMVDAREGEAEGAPPTRGALMALLRGTSGALAVAMGRVLGAPPACLPGLQALGTAYGVAGRLRSLPILARAGRTLLPADELAARGLGEEAAASDLRAAGVRAVALDLAAEGEALVREGRAGAAGLPASAIAAALPGVLARRDLARIRAPGWDPAAPPGPRGLGDRLAVSWAGWRGRV